MASIERVLDELRAGSDDLSEWAEQRGDGFFLGPDADVAASLGVVSEWASGQDYEASAVATFLQVADYWLIAHALAHDRVVVTHEVPAASPRRIKIPNVCIGLNVRCINPYQMLRAGTGPVRPRRSSRSRARAMTTFTEADVEDAALEWLAGIGWQTAYGPDIAPGGEAEERAGYGDVVLEGRVRDALARLNPGLPPDALDDAFRRLTRPEGSTLEARNRAFHRMLVGGVAVEYRAEDGDVRGARVAVLDFGKPAANDFLAVNQFTVTEREHTRRADIVLFVNGLPLGVIELKNPADEDGDLWDAWRQLQTYKAELPSLFAMNELLVASDGTEARLGTLTAGREWFKPWRTVAGEGLADTGAPELSVLIGGVCAPERLLPLIRDFIAFEDDGGALAKKLAGYHQFHAVRAAVAETLRAAELRGPVRIAEEPGRYEAGRRPGGERGDRRIGVVWHTQGAGKSLTMAFYAGAIAREPAMENPTIVVLTDRNDLDDQLFGTFARCEDLLGQPPVQAESRADLRREAVGRLRRRGVHHDPEVLPGSARRYPSRAVRPPQHRRHRRRGAPQPVRLHRRLRAAHARCPPQRLVRRLHRHARRAARRQHARGVR